MSLRSQFEKLLGQAAQKRQELFGGDVHGVMADEEGALPFRCYLSPVRTQEQLDAAQFRDIHDCILRVLKTEENFKCKIGAVVRIFAAIDGGYDLFLRLSERGISGLNPEYVVGCKNI